MIGTHNSISYLTPIHWYQRLLKPWYQCQSLTLEEQYNQGIRYFDIRVNWINNSWHLVHNFIDFGEFSESGIKDFIKDKDVYIRLGFDCRKTPEIPSYHVKKFKLLIDYLINIGWQIDSAITFWDWKELLEPTISCTEYHLSVTGDWYDYILGTKVFAKRHNASKFKESDFLYLIDYAQYIKK